MNLIDRLINKKSNRVMIVIKDNEFVYDSFKLIGEHELAYYRGKYGFNNIELIAKERMYSYEIIGTTAV